MKFGRQLTELVDPKFRNYCISYNMLKGFIAETDSKRGQILQTIQDVTLAAVPFLPPAHAEQLPSVRFQEALNGELEKINTFCQLEEDTLLGDLGVLLRRIRSEKAEFAELRVEADRLSEELCAFASFVDLNHTAFRKITKKESKVHKSSSSSWFMANVSRAAFMTVDFDRLVMLLASCYDLLVPTVVTPSTNRRRVLSAWVSSKDLVPVKVALAKAMHIVTPPEAITSIYFDTPWLSSYRDQITGSSSGLQVDISESSYEVTLPSGAKLVKNEGTWESSDQSFLPDKSFVPLVDCHFRRSLWGSTSIDICLDEGAQFSMHASQRRLESSKSAIFEGHALYVSATELPDWLTDIMGLPGVTEVPGFTKRVHGLFSFAEATIGVEGVPHPSWVAKSPAAISIGPNVTKPEPSKFVTQTEHIPTFQPSVSLRLWNLANWICGNRTALSQGRVVRDTILKIEPKSFFACERNLLDWIHVCVIVVGLAALHGGAVGSLLGIMPCLVLLWETRVFRQRNAAMMEKETVDYSDKIGPQLLFMILMVLTGDVLLRGALEIV